MPCPGAGILGLLFNDEHLCPGIMSSDGGNRPGSAIPHHDHFSFFCPASLFVYVDAPFRFNESY
jgi:hypothetical protein